MVGYSSSQQEVENADRQYIAFASVYDAADVRSWSGIPYYLISALEAAGHRVQRLGPLDQQRWRRQRWRQAWTRLATGQRYLRDRNPGVLQGWARELETRLARHASADLILSCSALPLAYLGGHQPAALWTDCTFGGMLDFYQGFTRLCPQSIREGHAAEQRAFDRCELLVFSSEWAAETARTYYRVDPGKIRVVPFGANLAWTPPTRAEVETLIDRRIASSRQRQECRLLLLGVEWERKGAPLALQVLERLRRQGWQATLTIAGCAPPAGTRLPDGVEIIPFLNKQTAEGAARVHQLLAESHFLLLPSRAECYGMVFTEANSMGLPCLATDVGGVGTIIRNGRNGHLFSFDDGPEQYAACVQQLLASPGNYERLSRGAFREYTERLNWRVAINRFSRLTQSLMNGSRPDNAMVEESSSSAVLLHSRGSARELTRIS